MQEISNMLNKLFATSTAKQSTMSSQLCTVQYKFNKQTLTLPQQICPSTCSLAHLKKLLHEQTHVKPEKQKLLGLQQLTSVSAEQEQQQMVANLLNAKNYKAKQKLIFFTLVGSVDAVHPTITKLQQDAQDVSSMEQQIAQMEQVQQSSKEQIQQATKVDGYLTQKMISMDNYEIPDDAVRSERKQVLQLIQAMQKRIDKIKATATQQ